VHSARSKPSPRRLPGVVRAAGVVPAGTAPALLHSRAGNVRALLRLLRLLRPPRNDQQSRPTRLEDRRRSGDHAARGAPYVAGHDDRGETSHKQQYEALVKVVRTLATGEYIFATPDCPEVYFLSGFRNPTRTTYDFFDDPTRRAERIRDTLARAHVGVVVLNWRPQYSGPPPAELVTHLREDYPKAVMVGAFEVRWRP